MFGDPSHVGDGVDVASLLLSLVALGMRRGVAADSGCLCGLDGRAEVSEGRLHLATTLWRVRVVGLGASL